MLYNLIKINHTPETKSTINSIDRIALKVVIIDIVREAEERENVVASKRESLEKELATVSDGIDVINGSTNYLNLYDGRAISAGYIGTDDTIVLEMFILNSEFNIVDKEWYKLL